MLQQVKVIRVGKFFPLTSKQAKHPIHRANFMYIDTGFLLKMRDDKYIKL